jgi:L-alanine-DL-glutamate epimerase-like enolase superfamily enzyme
MKITRIDTRLEFAQKSVVVRVRTGSGAGGSQQRGPFSRHSEATPDEIRPVIRDRLAPVLIGRDTASIRGALAEMDRVAPEALYAQAAVEMRLAKVKVGSRVEADRDRVAAVRAAVPGMSIRVDGNEGYDADTAIRLARAIARTGRVPRTAGSLEESGRAWSASAAPPTCR